MIDVGFPQPQPSPRAPRASLRIDAPHRGMSHGDLIGQYLHEIARYPLLSRDEEKILAVRIQRARMVFRLHMLRDPRVLRGVADTLRQLGRGELRIERFADVPVNDRKGRIRLQAISGIHGETLMGICQLVESPSGMHARRARTKRAVRLMDEAKLKTSVIEKIWRQLSRPDPQALRVCKLYETLRNRMVAANLRLAVAVARKYQGKGLPFLDLVQEASSGLFRAVEKFDPQRGLKFSTYAVWWAKQSVRSALTEKAAVVRIGTTALRRVREIKRQAASIEQQDARSVGLEEVAVALCIPRSEMRHCLRASRGVQSLDQTHEAGNGEAYVDTLIDPQAEDLMQRLVQGDNQRVVRQALRRLKDNERQVIRLRYGLQDGVYRNLAEVGRQMSLTRERIRQLEKASLRKLRDGLEDMEASLFN